MCSDAVWRLVVVCKCVFFGVKTSCTTPCKVLVLSLGFSVFLIWRPYCWPSQPPLYLYMCSGVLSLSVLRVQCVHLFSTSAFNGQTHTTTTVNLQHMHTQALKVLDPEVISLTLRRVAKVKKAQTYSSY